MDVTIHEKQRQEFECFCADNDIDPLTLRGLAVWEGWQASYFANTPIVVAGFLKQAPSDIPTKDNQRRQDAINITWQGTPKFDKTFCSQCGGEFGPGDHGHSHCDDHQTPAPEVEPEIDALETENRRLSDSLEAIDLDTKILVDEIDALKAEVERLRKDAEDTPVGASIAEEIYEAIKHGDEAHKEWLRTAINLFFASNPAPVKNKRES